MKQAVCNDKKMGGIMMKKRVLITCIAAVGCVTCFLAFNLTKCGGLAPIDSLTARDMITQRKIKIPVSFHKGYYNGTGTSVLTTLSSREMISKIEKLKSPFGKYFGTFFPHKRMLLQVPVANNKKMLCVLTEADLNDTENSKEGHFYLFSDLSVSCYNFKTDIKMILPFHLIHDDLFQYGADTLETEKSYGTDFTISDFLSFYTNFCMLYGMPNGCEQQGEKLVLKEPLVKSLSSRTKAIIEFSDQGDKRFFSVTFNE